MLLIFDYTHPPLIQPQTRKPLTFLPFGNTSKLWYISVVHPFSLAICHIFLPPHLSNLYVCWTLWEYTLLTNYVILLWSVYMLYIYRSVKLQADQLELAEGWVSMVFRQVRGKPERFPGPSHWERLKLYAVTTSAGSNRTSFPVSPALGHCVPLGRPGPHSSALSRDRGGSPTQSAGGTPVQLLCVCNVLLSSCHSVTSYLLPGQSVTLCTSRAWFLVALHHCSLEMPLGQKLQEHGYQWVGFSSFSVTSLLFLSAPVLSPLFQNSFLNVSLELIIDVC